MDKKIGSGYRQDSTYGGNCTNVTIKGGTIVATAEMYGNAIGKGSGMTCAASNIFVDASLVKPILLCNTIQID